MASTSVQGNWAAQARVFGHDAIPVALDSVSKVEVDAPGSAYSMGDVITLTTVACDVEVTSLDIPLIKKDANLFNSIATNQTDFVDGTYTGVVGVTAGYTTSGSGTGLELSIEVSGNTVTSIIILNAGSGNGDGDIIGVTGSGGVLGGATGNLRIVLGTGGVKEVIVVPKPTATGSQPYGKGATIGTSYAQSAVVNFNGISAPGVGFTGEVTETNLPHTDVRGASLYVTADLTELSVVMESGNLYATSGPAHTANFKGVQAGTFLPILVKKVVAWTSGAGSDEDLEIIALY